MTSDYHAPVLLAEVLHYLGSAKRVLDCTLGGGGHARALIEHGATVVGIDRDPAALQETRTALASDVERGKLHIIEGAFADVVEGPDLASEQFDGTLLDLGVSSHQFDAEGRGFTFREGAPLDMRMSSTGDTAAEWLNSANEDALENAFREYGDEPRARKLARTVARRRDSRPFETSDDLVGAIRAVLGPRSGRPEFARLFQAVRIAVNGEIDQLRRALPAIRDRLTSGGVLVAIGYHSIEDRVVKQTFQEWSRACTCPPRQPMCTCGGIALGETLTRKPVIASDEEVARNPRSRSAKLRAWRRGNNRITE